MITTEQVFNLATKEHTTEFKRAVELCKRSNPDKDDAHCFAVITGAFNKANKPIFLSEGNFDLDNTRFSLVELGRQDEVKLEVFKTEYAALQKSNISADAKRTALRKLLSSAKTAGIEANTEMANLDEEGILADFSTYRDFNDELSQDMVSTLTDQVSIELSGVAHKWESLGHALRVTGELMKPGTFTGIDGKTCRWTDTVLKNHYKTLFGAPVKMFHKAEGMYRRLPAPAGEVVGHITHLAEYFGRIFYKAMVFPKKAQSLIMNGFVDSKGHKRAMKESLEARVALAAPDSSGVHDITAWQGIGFVFTDRPAVKGRDDKETNPVALARKNTMPDDDQSGTEGSGTQPPASPPGPSPNINLSASDLQKLITSAVGDATVSLSTKLDEVTTNLAATQKDLKELANVRNVARLAEVHAMEENIKENDPDFKPEMLYDPEKATLAQKEHDLGIYIRGLNKGAKLKGQIKPAVVLAEEEADEGWLDEVSMQQYGKPYKAMLAGAPATIDGGSE